MIHDFWIGLSDFLIAGETLVILALLKHRKTWSEWGIFLGTGMAAFLGGIFHWCFPEKIATFGGLILWYGVALSLSCVASGIIYHIFELLKIGTKKYSAYLMHIVAIIGFLVFFGTTNMKFYYLIRV